MSFSRISVTTPPPAKPITLSDVYFQLRLDTTGSPPTNPDDAALNRMISSATDWAEQATQRALIQQDVRLIYHRFPCDRIYFRAQETLWTVPGDYDIRPRHIQLLRPPLLSVPEDGSLVQYYDQTNTLQVLDASWYVVNQDEQVATIELLQPYVWPVCYLREDAVILNYTAGYAPLLAGSPPVPTDYAANVPDGIKQAMLIHVQRSYDPMTPEKYKQLSEAMDDLVGGFQVFFLLMSILSNTDCRRLDQRIVVQQKVNGTQDPVSGVVPFVWTTVATIWACVDATKANERYLGQQEASGKGYTIWVRWRADLTADMRILWNGDELNIISIPDNQKRGRFMSIFATAGENEG